MLDWLKKVLFWILSLLGWEPEPPEPKTAYQLVVRPECQVAVRDKPLLEAPTEWRLKENEKASLGTEMTTSYDGTWKFYFIRFGEKTGWVKWDVSKMYIVMIEV